TNNMAGRACHVVGSTTQVGLTQGVRRVRARATAGSRLWLDLLAIRPRLSRSSGGRLRTVVGSRTQSSSSGGSLASVALAARGRGGNVGPARVGFGAFAADRSQGVPGCPGLLFKRACRRFTSAG